MTLGATLSELHQQHAHPQHGQHLDTSSFSCCSLGCGDDDLMATDLEASGYSSSNTSLLQQQGQSDGDSRAQDWDINDISFELSGETDSFQVWPNGNCKFVYPASVEEARRHTSGWAMRNTNNHNVSILKKSCLGVLVCSRSCLLQHCDPPQRFYVRPAICDKARKKQYGKPCPNPGCDGVLVSQACRGHAGYPVTHFWRHVERGLILFQAKGFHDHPMPEVRAAGETKRRRSSGLRHQHGSSPKKRRTRDKIDVTAGPYPAASLNKNEVNAVNGADVASLTGKMALTACDSPYFNNNLSASSNYFDNIMARQQHDTRVFVSRGLVPDLAAERQVQNDLERAVHESLARLPATADANFAATNLSQVAPCKLEQDSMAFYWGGENTPIPYNVSGPWYSGVKATGDVKATSSCQHSASPSHPRFTMTSHSYADWCPPAIDVSSLQPEISSFHVTNSSNSSSSAVQSNSAKFPLPEIGEIINPGRSGSNVVTPKECASDIFYPRVCSSHYQMPGASHPYTYDGSTTHYFSDTEFPNGGVVYGLSTSHQYVTEDDLVTYYEATCPEVVTSSYRSLQFANDVDMHNFTSSSPTHALNACEPGSHYMQVEPRVELRSLRDHYPNVTYPRSHSELIVSPTEFVTYFEI